MPSRLITHMILNFILIPKKRNLLKTKIKESVDPRKWICVEASNVIVKSKGDLVILIMADTEMTSAGEAIAPKLEANFDNL